MTGTRDDSIKDEAARPRRRGFRSVWAWLFLVAALLSGGCAAYVGISFGWPALVLLIGICITSIFAIVPFFMPGDDHQQLNMVAQEEQQALTLSFSAMQEPSLVMRGGKPVRANQAYLTLAAELGVEDFIGAPPAVERLFKRKEKAASAAIFRLHHTAVHDDFNEETIRTLTPNGSYRTFTVRVTGLDGAQIWQIIEQSRDEAGSTLLATAPVGLFSIREDGHIIEINDILLGWLGIEGRLNMPQRMNEFIENPDLFLGASRTPGRTIRSDTRLITRKGVVAPTVMTGQWHELETGDLYASIALYGHSGLGTRPERRKMERRGAEGGGRRATDTVHPDAQSIDALGGAPFGIVELNHIDPAVAKIVWANDSLHKMVGAEDLTNSEFSALFRDDEDTDKFLQAQHRNSDAPLNIYLAGPHGLPVDIYFSSASHQGCMAYIVDISPRKALEDQLVQSRKMQAIGQLAGGVAHDFNNVLTAIRLNTDELLGRHPLGDPSYPELQKINQAGARAADLVGKLLAFSRKQTVRREVLDVTETLSEATGFLRRLMVERVKLDIVHGRGLPPILADKTQFDNVMMNLCVNARDAIIEKGAGDGTITISSALASADELAQRGIDGAGPYCRIDVTDTGIGMDAKTQAKIFEPFFTTKELGKGTGLGLSTVYGNIQQSGGHLRVRSALGAGTTFSVYMPLADENAISAAAQPPAMAASNGTKAPKPPSDMAGQGRILFVEDEESVRAIAAKTLRKRGYTVTEAGDGEEAFELLEEAQDPFDLMISDVVMPGMGGPALLKKGRPLLGDARIVFISGYAEEEFSDLLSEEPDVTFLPKPFTLAQLAERVKAEIGDAQ